MSHQSTLSPDAFVALRHKVFPLQYRAAIALDVTQCTLSRWECGRAAIPRWAVHLLRAWERLGAPPEEDLSNA